jgi:hypothetical protein
MLFLSYRRARRGACLRDGRHTRAGQSTVFTEREPARPVDVAAGADAPENRLIGDAVIGVSPPCFRRSASSQTLASIAIWNANRLLRTTAAGQPGLGGQVALPSSAMPWIAIDAMLNQVYTNTNETAGDDVEDEDEAIGDAEAIDDCNLYAPPAVPARQFLEGSLFNLEENFSCRFSAGAGSGIALCNLWLMIRKRRGDRRRRGGNGPTAKERLFEDGPAMRRYSGVRVGLAGAQTPRGRRRRAARTVRWSVASSARKGLPGSILFVRCPV